MSGCSKCGGAGGSGWLTLVEPSANINLSFCVPCLAQVFMIGTPQSQIGPMPGGGWGYSGAGTVQGDEYEALNPDEATRTLLEVYQGKYHRDSYQDRVAALAKDGIFLCKKK